MLRSTTVGVTLAVALGVAAPAEAQHIDDRRGFWIGLGVGAALTKVNCDFCGTDRTLGPSGFVQLGGTPSRKTLAGVEVTYWRGSDPDTTREYVSATAIVKYYFSIEYPVFVKGGGGIGRYAEETSTGDAVSSSGFSFVVGTGYDLRMTARIWAAPYVNYVIAPAQEGTRNRIALSTDISQNLWQFGVRLSYH